MPSGTTSQSVSHKRLTLQIPAARCMSTEAGYFRKSIVTPLPQTEISNVFRSRVLSGYALA